MSAFGGYEELARRGGQLKLEDILRVLNSVDTMVRNSSQLPENVLRIEINVSDDNGEALSMEETIEFDFVPAEMLGNAMEMGSPTADECFLTITGNKYSFKMAYDDEDPDTGYHEIVYEISEENGYAKFVSNSEEERPFNGLAYKDTYFLLSPWKRLVEKTYIRKI